LKVAELKKILKYYSEKGFIISGTGNKDILIHRLQALLSTLFDDSPESSESEDLDSTLEENNAPARLSTPVVSASSSASPPLGMLLPLDFRRILVNSENRSVYMELILSRFLEQQIVEAICELYNPDSRLNFDEIMFAILAKQTVKKIQMIPLSWAHINLSLFCRSSLLPSPRLKTKKRDSRGI
jgi:hypothetical protein